MPPIEACRSILANVLNRGNPSHPSLILSRYLVQADDNEGKLVLFEKAEASIFECREVYRLSYTRWKEALPALHAQECILNVQGRMIIGLGSDNVLETGITLHHTYGVPYIPGSALKGLAAHYAHSVWGSEDDGERKKFLNRAANKKENIEAFQGEWHKVLFGDQTGAGYITFHDAWITPDSLSGSLCRDVMTVHHPEYYQAAESDNQKAPTDFDSPTPIPFLSVTGSFHVAVSCDVNDEKGKRWAELALDLLKEALENWGIGGKTNSGYGRLGPQEQNAQTPTADRQNAYVPGAGPPGGQLKNDDIVLVKLVEQTPNGAWKAKHERNIKPSLVRTSGAAPAEWRLEEEVEVRVAINTDGSMVFVFPARQPAQGAGRQGGQGNRPGNRQGRDKRRR